MQRDHDQQVGVPTWVWAFACAILIALGVVATTNAARAADKGGPSANFLEVKDVEKAPWTGPWASVNLSYTMQSTEVGPFAFDANSVSYGVGVGYDIQLGRVVVGVMADHDWTKADSAISEFSRSWFAGAHHRQRADVRPCRLHLARWHRSGGLRQLQGPHPRRWP
jgi:hypothetical protein